MHSFKKVKLELGKVCVSLKEDSPNSSHFLLLCSFSCYSSFSLQEAGICGFFRMYDQILSNITSHTFS